MDLSYLLFHICFHFDLSFSDDDVIKWKHFPRYRSFVRGIHPWYLNRVIFAACSDSENSVNGERDQLGNVQYRFSPKSALTDLLTVKVSYKFARHENTRLMMTALYIHHIRNRFARVFNHFASWNAPQGFFSRYLIWHNVSDINVLLALMTCLTTWCRIICNKMIMYCLIFGLLSWRKWALT